MLGGAVSPRGGDVAGGIRPTHSPTVFIHDLGQAYRDSGRTAPIMDGFAFHPYEDNSSIAPRRRARIRTRRRSRSPTTTSSSRCSARRSATTTLPIWYDEFGVESQIPAAKQALYTGTEPTTTKPVTEATQAAYYRQAVQLAFCQPNVRGLFLFHTVDETDLAGWQSGLYYADDTPKSSLPRCELALDESRRGVVAHCDGLELTVQAEGRAARRGAHAHLRPRLHLRRAALPPARQAARRRSAAARSAASRRRCRCASRRRRGARTGSGCRRRARSIRGLPTLAPRNVRHGLAFAPWKASTSRTPSTASIRRGGGSRSRSGRPRKDAFAEVVEDFADRFDHLRAYTTTGVRPETDFFLWKITDRYEALGELGAALNGTPLAGWLETPYSYLATTKASQYTSARRARKIVPQGSPYLVVYPFEKVRPWYALPEEDRQRAMDEHITIGREEFPGIKNHTTLLVRDRRPGVHDGVRVRRAGRLHAPDAAPARQRGVAPTRCATRRSSSAST